MSRNAPSIPRGRELSTLLDDTGWQHLASTKLAGTPNTLDIYAKNGRIIVVEEFGQEGESGVELFYPSSQQTLSNLVAEANAYAADATIIIATNKVPSRAFWPFTP